MKKLLIGLLALGSISTFAEVEEIGAVKFYKTRTNVDLKECLFNFQNDSWSSSYCKINISDLSHDYKIFGDILGVHSFAAGPCQLSIIRKLKTVEVYFHSLARINARNSSTNLQGLDIQRECLEAAEYFKKLYVDSEFLAVPKIND